MDNSQEQIVTSEELLAELSDEELESASEEQESFQTVTIDLPYD